MKPHALYLHGFGSGPNSSKGNRLRERLGSAVCDFVIPNLDGGDFRHTTLELQRQRAVAAIEALPDDRAPILLCGSSLGGWLAAWIAASGAMHRPFALLLVAPAFAFTKRWGAIIGAQGIADWERDGTRPFFHHASGTEVPVDSAFLRSCRSVPAHPEPPPSWVPVAVVHGRRDETVDLASVMPWVERCPQAEFHMLDSDHSLTDPEAEDCIAASAKRLIKKLAAVG